VFGSASLTASKWSHSRVSWIPSTLTIAVGITGPVAGWLLDRFEARVVMGTGAALAGAGFIFASRAVTFSEVLIANLILGVGLGTSAWLPASVVIANWFGERRGTALGLATAGMEAGGMVMTFLAGYIISRSGWRAAYTVLVFPIFILVLPLLVIVMRTRPQGDVTLTITESSRSLPGLEVSAAIRTRAFWRLVIAQLTWGLSFGVFIHAIAYLMGIGHSLQFATTVVGLVAGLAAIGKPVMGALADRIGGNNALGISLLLIAVAINLLLGARTEWLIPYMLVTGLAAASPAALVPMVAAETLGLKRFGTLYGWIQVFVTLGTFLGPLIAGRLYDLTHTYTESFEVLAVIVVGGAVASFMCVAPRSVSLRGQRHHESAV